MVLPLFSVSKFSDPSIVLDVVLRRENIWPIPINNVVSFKGGGRYRLIGLGKFPRNKNCSSDKINNNRECLNYGRRYRYTLKMRGHFSLLCFTRSNVSGFSIILAKNECCCECVWIQICNLKHIIKYFFAGTTCDFGTELGNTATKFGFFFRISPISNQNNKDKCYAIIL